MKKIVLCADDYGQSAAISEGILQLVEQGRLSATSCMSDGPYWNDSRNRLPEFVDRIDIGLHFNLTHAFPSQLFPAQPLSTLLRDALIFRIDKNAIAAALEQQLDRFEAVLERRPDFVDGHQHVHVFPGIRSAVMQVLERRYPGKKPYLRALNPRLPGHGGTVKLAFLKLLGSGFTDTAARFGMQTNRGFTGIYSLQPDQNFPQLMQNWLCEVRDGDLLMCHPGNFAAASDDPIAATRPLELTFLQSTEFAKLLATANVKLSRLRDL
jgi:predicted glycoside hydrolase/deacetylase ChbG (UPF0249 family)